MRSQPTQEQLAAIVTDYMPLIKSEARRLNRRMAEEIVQEAVVGIMRSKTFDPDQPIGGWVKWVVLGAYTQLGKMERRHVKADLSTGQNIEDLRPVNANQEAVVELTRIRARIADLSPRQREVAELLLAGHESYEMGRLLGINRQSAKELVARTRQKLAA